MKATKIIKSFGNSLYVRKGVKYCIDIRERSLNVYAYFKEIKVFDFFIYFDEFGSLSRDTLTNSLIVLDDIKKFLLLNGLLLSDKAEKQILDVLMISFSTFSSDFGKYSEKDFSKYASKN